MHSILAVFRRELALYFRSPVAYAIAFALLLFLGMLFNGFIAQANAALVLRQRHSGRRRLRAQPADLSHVSHRAAADHAAAGGGEPRGHAGGAADAAAAREQLHHRQVSGGLGLLHRVAVLSLVFYILQTFVGAPDAGVALGAYGGAWLYGGAVLAITMIWSAVTEDQIVAAFLGSATILVLYLAEIAAIWIAGQGSASVVADFVRELGLQAHFSVTLAQGVVRAEDIAYFVFVIIGALFITTRLVETRRWRA